MSTHTHPGRRPAPTPEETWLAVRRLALLAVTALLVARLTGAFAGIVLCVVGLAALAAHAAHAAARSRAS
jgi:hypothetical protein